MPLMLAACASAPPYDELAAEDTTDNVAIDGKADGGGGTFTYYSIVTDLRRCAYPMCGGYWVTRLDRSFTWCADGTAQPMCYTPALDWSQAGLAQTTQQKLLDAAARHLDGVTGIVRGHLTASTFVVTEAWAAESATISDGVFVKIVPSGIVCITTPCPTLTEKRLNSYRTANIAEIDWSPAELTDREIQGFTDEIYAGTGAIIAGDRYYFKGGKGRTATAAYHRLHD